MKHINYKTLLIAVLSICLCAYTSSGQTGNKSTAQKSPYERLLETQKEYEAAMKKGDSLEVAEMCYLMGKRYIGLKDYTKAQQWFLRSLRIREPLGPSEDIGKIYGQMAGFPIYSWQSPMGQHYNYLSYLNFKAGTSPRSKMEAHKLWANFHLLSWKHHQPLPHSKQIGSLDSVLYYAELALRAAKIEGNPLNIGGAYGYLSGIWKLKNNPEKSNEYQQKLLEVYTKAKLMNNVMAVYKDTGEELLKQNKPLLAKPWLDKADSLAGNVTDNSLNEQLEEVYGLYYEQTGQWKKAFQYQKKGLGMKKQEFDIQLNQAIQNLLLLDKYEQEKAQFAAQQKEMALQNKLAAVVFILFLGAGIAGVLFYWLFVKYKKISKENAALVEEQTHRTKNNLQSVSALLNLQRHQLSDPVAVKTMEESLLRIEAMLLAHHKLYQGNRLVEIQLIKYLPDLIKSVLRSYHLESIPTTYHLQDVWLHNDQAIPLGLIVNELTTNACKYAFQKHTAPALSVSCSLHEGIVSLAFADNGPGFVSESQSASFGLKLIHIMSAKLKAESKFNTTDGCHFEISFLKKQKVKENNYLKTQPIA